MTPKEQAFKNVEGRIDTIQKLSIEILEYVYLAAYNEAIEDAIKMCEHSGNQISGANIRSLKK